MRKVAVPLIFLLIIAVGFVTILLRPKGQRLIQGTLGSCKSNPKPIFTHDITDLEKIDFIVPPGNVEDWEGEKIFKSHSYMRGPNKVPIYAPINSYLYKGVYVNEDGIKQYGLFFEVSCEVFYLFDHVVDPVEKIAKAFPEKPSRNTQDTVYLKEKIKFEGGEIVGYSIGEEFEQWDFGAYDKTQHNSFNNPNIPELTERDLWATCPYDYFPEEKKGRYYSLFKNHLTNVPIPTLFCKP